MKKNKPRYHIRLYCSCGQFLFRYEKEGPGTLQKCFKSNITDDTTSGDGICVSCKTQFAKNDVMHGRPILRVIKERINVRGHTGKK